MIGPDEVKKIRVILKNADEEQLKAYAEDWLTHVASKNKTMLNEEYEKFRD